MSRTQPPDVPPSGLLNLTTAPDRPAGALVPPMAVGDTEAELPCDHLEIQTDFVLDAEGWGAWLEIVDSPPRDLQGLCAFLTEPVECLHETPADSGMTFQRRSSTP